MEIFDILTNNKNKKIPEELNEFNWGAFLLTFIWGIKYKIWLTLAIIPLAFINMPLYFNWVLIVALQVYCGINGNKWAYQQDWWKKPVEFRKTQLRWAILAITLNLFIPLSIIAILGAFVKKSDTNILDFVENTQCKIIYEKIKDGIKKAPYGIDDPLVIEKEFAKLYKNAQMDESSVIFDIAGNNELMDAFRIDFEKNDSECNIETQNCTITGEFISPSELYQFKKCVFFYDTKHNVKPDEQTSEAIKKGYNIFKYL